MLSHVIELYRAFVHGTGIYEYGPAYLAAIYLGGMILWRLRARLPPSIFAALRPATRLRRLVAVGAVLAILVAIAETVFYLFWPLYLNIIEVTSISVAWATAHGAPLYPGLDSPFRTEQCYGPLFYLIEGFWLRLFGPSLMASKLVGCVSIVLTFVLLTIVVRRHLGSRACALAYSGIVAYGLLIILPWYGTAKPDPLILMLTAAALLLATARPSVLVAALLGAVAGALANLKLHAPLYALPALGYYLGRTALPRRDLLVIALAGTASLALPFLASPVSAAGYIAVMRMTAQHSLSGLLLAVNLMFASAIAAPVAWAFLSRGIRPDASLRLALCGFAVSLALVVVIGAKPGSGWYHLWPELANCPSAGRRRRARATERDRASRERLDAFLTLAAVALITPMLIGPQHMLIELFKHYAVFRQQEAAVEGFLSRHDGEQAAMGYGGDDTVPQSGLRVLFAFRGVLPRLELVSMMDLAFAGEPTLVEANYDDLARCEPRIWLLPHGEPFSVTSGYDAKPLFPARFRESFVAHYRLQQTGRFFDEWVCKEP